MRTKLLAVAGALIVLGVLAFMLQPGAPEGECAPEGATQTSGFQDAESGCPLTIESADEIMDYNSAPKPFRIAGLVLRAGRHRHRRRGAGAGAEQARGRSRGAGLARTLRPVS